jgi:hypothetical protein
MLPSKNHNHVILSAVTRNTSPKPTAKDPSFFSAAPAAWLLTLPEAEHGSLDLLLS